MQALIDNLNKQGQLLGVLYTKEAIIRFLDARLTEHSSATYEAIDHFSKLFQPGDLACWCQSYLANEECLCLVRKGQVIKVQPLIIQSLAAWS